MLELFRGFNLPVITITGIKYLDELTTEDEVLVQNGVFKRVVNIEKREYSGRYLQFRTSFCNYAMPVLAWQSIYVSKFREDLILDDKHRFDWIRGKKIRDGLNYVIINNKIYDERIKYEYDSQECWEDFVNEIISLKKDVPDDYKLPVWLYTAPKFVKTEVVKCLLKALEGINIKSERFALFVWHLSFIAGNPVRLYKSRNGDYFLNRDKVVTYKDYFYNNELTSILIKEKDVKYFKGEYTSIEVDGEHNFVTPFGTFWDNRRDILLNKIMV
jgi:hypothetical protein